MPSRKKEVKTVVAASFPDLLGEEEARINRRQSYPSEVTVEKAVRSDDDDLEADGLLDELLNDGESLTDSDDERTKDSHVDSVEAKSPDKELESNSSSILDGILSLTASATKEIMSIGSSKNENKTEKPEKRVTYSDEVKTHLTPSDDTSKTDSERSSGRFEEEEEAIEIVSDDEETEVGQEVELQNGSDIQVHEQDDDEYEESEDEDEDDDDDESANSSGSNATQDLLERAHDRLNMQSLYEEIGQLRRTVERKDKEIEQLSGQLRRAVATKCDLVIAHTELERHHEFNLSKLEEATKHLLKANFGLVEEQASTDVVCTENVMREILIADCATK